jgi:hypothetical protein
LWFQRIVERAKKVATVGKIPLQSLRTKTKSARNSVTRLSQIAAAEPQDELVNQL